MYTATFHIIVVLTCILYIIIVLIVTVTVKNRKVVVKGPRGTLSRDFSHLPIDLHLVKEVCIIY